MAYQPTNPHPYMETIDATQENQFCCKVDEQSIVTGATLQIFKETRVCDTLINWVSPLVTGTSSILKIGDSKNGSDELYFELKEKLSNGTKLQIKIDDEIIDIIQVSYLGSQNRIHLSKSVYLDKNEKYYIYSDEPAKIILDVDHPIYGGISDNSWISCNVNNEALGGFLANGRDYSWNLILNLDEKKYIDSGNIESISSEGNSDFYCKIPLSNTVFLQIKEDYEDMFLEVKSSDKIFTLSIKKVESDSGSSVITLKIKDDELSDEDKNNIRQCSSYKLYKGNITFTTPRYYFKTRTTPLLEFNPVVPEIINTGAHVFKAVYSQAEGTQFSYYQFDLYQDEKLIDSSGHQNGRLISYAFESFINQGNYKIVLTVVDNDGVESQIAKNFKVDYTLLNSTIFPKTIVDNSNSCIEIDYSNHVKIPGKVSDEIAVSGENYGINISDKGSLLWDEMSGKSLSIPYFSTQVIRWHGEYGFHGNIAEVYNSEFPWNSTSVSFDGKRFSVTMKGEPATVNYNSDGLWELYDEDIASALAGDGNYSYIYNNYEYNNENKTITLPSKPNNIAAGDWVQINNTHRKIIEVDGTSITLDRSLPETPSSPINIVIYKENYLYSIADDKTISDENVLIDNDKMNKYWWLIVFNPEGDEDRVNILKSVIFKSEV